MLRNVSRRPLVVALSRGAAAAGVTVRTRPERVVLRPGGSREIEVSVAARVLPAAPGALEGVVGAVVGPGTAAHLVCGGPGHPPRRRHRRRAVPAGVPPERYATRRPRVRRGANRRLGRAAPDPSADRARAPALPGPAQGRHARAPSGRASGQVRLRDHRTRSPAETSAAARTRCRWWGRPSGAGRRPVSGSPSACARRGLESGTSCGRAKQPMSATEAAAHLRRTRSRSRARNSARRREVRRRPEPHCRPGEVQEDRRGLGPGRDGRRHDARLRGLPGRAQRHARAGEGRHPLPPGDDPGRGQGARDVDDLEVRPHGPSLRRREGGVVCDPKLLSASELERLTRRVRRRSSATSARKDIRRPTSAPTAR